MAPFTTLLPSHPTVYSFTWRLGDVELLVLGNFTGIMATLDAAGKGDWEHADILISNVTDPTPIAHSHGRERSTAAACDEGRRKGGQRYCKALQSKHCAGPYAGSVVKVVAVDGRADFLRRGGEFVENGSEDGQPPQRRAGLLVDN